MGRCHGRASARPRPVSSELADVGRAQGPEPTDDPAEIIGEALVFAAANDRPGVVDSLLDAGATSMLAPTANTTGLHLAIQFRKPAMVRHLLDRGAYWTIQDDEYHSDAAGWAEACKDGRTYDFYSHTAISIAAARNAATEFVTTDGSRPANLQWIREPS